ncbi:tyrosine-type recombinase/integrase [Nocardia brasiliensis]|uniref:tyrosine-type recombinase/integrase n=1 Tax=Nocardia brasiliensis TaxID=37326 RepID=UPI0004A6E4D4|nr:tyrosine-type recombinase/integrase [Nocardia brasiliensis]
MVDRGREPWGSARLELVDGVALLRPEDVVLEAMLRGWQAQQVGGRGLRKATVTARLGVVKRFLAYTNEYPWHWSPAHLDEWMVDQISRAGLAKSTMRSYQDALNSFCDYLIRPEYHWVAECLERFGTHPVQICFEWNTRAHLANYEGNPDRRPMTREEVQQLFDYADDQVDVVLRRHRKGALSAYRDATLLKVIYAYGLRATEAAKLDEPDWYRNPKAPELGRYGNLEVRWGKSSRGSPPRRRTVHTVMPWIVEVIEDYVHNIRPRYGFPGSAAMWLTERGGRITPRHIEARFAEYRRALGLDETLVPHCLRHSYVTHQIEDGVDPRFVQEQVGHRFASTTAIYTGVSGDFMNTMMAVALAKAFETEA